MHSFFIPVQHCLLQRMKGIAEEANTAEGKGRESQWRHKQSTTRKQGCSCGWHCSPPTRNRIFSFHIRSLPFVKVNEFGLTQLINSLIHSTHQSHVARSHLQVSFKAAWEGSPAEVWRLFNYANVELAAVFRDTLWGKVFPDVRGCNFPTVFRQNSWHDCWMVLQSALSNPCDILTGWRFRC